MITAGRQPTTSRQTCNESPSAGTQMDQRGPKLPLPIAARDRQEGALEILAVAGNSDRSTERLTARKSNTQRRRIDWEVIERWVVTTPRATLSEAAERFEVSIRSVMYHGGSKKGRWIEKQTQHYHKLAQFGEERMTEILAQDRADDATVFRQLEFRLQKVVLSSLELLFPPEDAPIEAHIAATNRLEAMNAKQLSTIVCEGLRTLTETGRHRRLLTGQSTAIFSRAEAPDIMLPIPLEEARALEMRSRMAQTAFLAMADGLPIDVSGCVISPLTPLDSSKSLNRGSADARESPTEDEPKGECNGEDSLGLSRCRIDHTNH